MAITIRTKFTFWYIGSFLLLIGLSFLVSEVIFHHFSIRGIDQALLTGARQVERSLPACFQSDPAIPDETISDCFNRILRTQFPADVVYAQLIEASDVSTAQFNLLAKSDVLRERTFPFSPELKQVIQTRQPGFESLKKWTTGMEVRVLTMPVNVSEHGAYLLQFGIRTGDVNEPWSLQSASEPRAHIFVLIFSLLLVMVCGMAYLFMKRAFAPIHQVVTLAKRISAEDLSHRIDLVKSHDEIGELAETFNAMIARLEGSFQQIQQFSSDVAHELKTPLTVLKGELEVALRKARSAEEYRVILAELLESTNGLSKMVEDLLLLARMEAQRLPLSFAPVALDELALNVYENMLKLAEAKHLTVNLNTMEQVTVSGDPGLLERVIKNVLVNAINYTPEGGSIDLSITSSPDGGMVTISDTGIGIPEQAVPHIFDRFYRVDQSRSHESGGTGLGLAIVKKIVEVHHGTIDVQSQVGAGTTVKIWFSRSNLAR